MKIGIQLTNDVTFKEQRSKLTLCSQVSGFAHCGRKSAASMSINSPSESDVLMINPGISLDNLNRSETINHSSEMLSPT